MVGARGLPVGRRALERSQCESESLTLRGMSCASGSNTCVGAAKMVMGTRARTSEMRFVKIMVEYSIVLFG